MNIVFLEQYISCDKMSLIDICNYKFGGEFGTENFRLRMSQLYPVVFTSLTFHLSRSYECESRVSADGVQ